MSGANYDPFATKEEKVDERIWSINQLGQYELLTTDLSEEEEVSIKTEEELTQLDAIVEEIAKHAEESQATLPEKPWLPPLATEIVSPLLKRNGKNNENFLFLLVLWIFQQNKNKSISISICTN